MSKDLTLVGHNLSILMFSYGLLKHDKFFGDNPKNLLSFSKKNFKNCEKLTRNELSKKTVFDDEENLIIKKSLEISNYVIANKLIDLSCPSIEILSLNDFNTIGDIKVTDKILDLNLNSLNLGNLDIYRFLFLFTKSTKYNNKNIFEVFAREELTNLFRKGCDILIQELSSKSYEAKLTKVSYSKSIDKLYFFYQGQEYYIDNFSFISYDDFFKIIPTSYLKVFSDCFDLRVKYSATYKNEKNVCLMKVKEQIERIIDNKPDNFSMNTLVYSLFKLTNFSYYLLYLDNNDVKHLNIPSRTNFNTHFEVISITVEVDNGLLNLKINLHDKTTHNKISLSNVLDYYNGEFFSNPNLKTNIDNDLLNIVYEVK